MDQMMQLEIPTSNKQETTVHEQNAPSRIVQDSAIRITYVGMACNFAMAVVKLAGGWTFKSDIIVADGWHSLTDLTSDFLTLATVSCEVQQSKTSQVSFRGWIKPACSLVLACMLVLGGCRQGLESIESLGYYYNLTHTHVASSPEMHEQDFAIRPSMSAAWIALATIVMKEWLYHSTMRVAKAIDSSALGSNAAHHRADSLSALVALIAVLGATLTRNTEWIDPLGGLVISIMTLSAGTRAIVGVSSH